MEAGVGAAWRAPFVGRSPVRYCGERRARGSRAGRVPPRPALPSARAAEAEGPRRPWVLSGLGIPVRRALTREEWLWAMSRPCGNSCSSFVRSHCLHPPSNLVV